MKNCRINKYQTPIYNIMIRVLLAILLTQSIVSQPRCSTSGIPAELPALEMQHILLDLNRHIFGPNLTMELASSSPLITLMPKLTLHQQRHNLNNILEITNANGIVSMLGVSSTNKFYIYYASTHNPNLLKAKEIPLSLTRCTNHALSADAAFVAITCENQNRSKYAVAYSKLNDIDPWEIHYTTKYAASSTREIQFVGANRLAVLIMHPFNSYIEVWDTLYGRIIGIFDRFFLSLEYLNIVDVTMTGGSLFILDYSTGIYELKFEANTFLILRQLQFTYYSKMAVYLDSIVISKKGSITEFGGKNVFKYETVGSQPIKQLIISDEYIIVYMSSLAVGYLRGYPTPYFTISIENEMIWGTFINDTEIIQTVSNENTTEMILQSIQLFHPYLIIPENVLNRSQIVVNAVSTLYGEEERCKLNFTLLRTEEHQMEIFDSQLSRNGTEHIYMNRPGRAEIDLTGYGMGPNLNYDVQMFAETVNLTVEVRKKRVIEDIRIEGLDKLRAKATYFSDTCGLYRNECPLAIDTYNLGMMRFYLCGIETDFYGVAHHINCTQKFKQFRPGEYIHYQLEQSSGQLDHFYQISINDNAQNEISVRKFQITPQFFRPVLSQRIKINGTNKYGENNITQLEFDEDSKLLYVLMPRNKVIHVYQLVEGDDEISAQLVMGIDRESVGGRLFVPSRFELDSDGGLWVKNIDEIIVFDFREIDRIDKPVILNTIPIKLDQVKNYNYLFEVAEQTKSSQLFAPLSQPMPRASTKGYEQRNRKYLVIYNDEDTLLMCTVSHLYEIDQRELQSLPMYGYHVPKDRKDRFIQSLGNSQIFVTLYGFGEVKVNMIYNLDCLSLVSSYYTSIQTKNTALPAYFYISTANPIIMFFETTSNSSTSAVAFQLTTRPKMLLTLSEMLGQTQSQQLLIKVYNERVQIRHSVLLGISNSPENLTKGFNYPYPNYKSNALDRYIEADTLGWVAGNVIKISYACNDCQKPADEDQPYVEVKGKLWLKADMSVAGAHELEVISNKGSEVAMLRNNMVYLLDSQSSQLLGAYQVTQSPTDTILSLKVNPQSRIVACALKTDSQIQIVTYSIANFKGFPLSRLSMPSQVKYVINMDYKQNVLVVLDFSNVYIVSVDHFGESYLVDYFNQVEAGGSICWAELLQPLPGTDNEYTLILTLCESGITSISFKLEQNFSILTILNKQSLDLKQNLNSLNIRMPTDSSFIRTLTARSPDGNELSLLMTIRNFNSFQWRVKLRNKVIITSVDVSRIVHRYGDFGATQDASLEGDGRFLVITYYGLIDEHYRYIHAVYDLRDTFQGSPDEPYQNCYIMESIKAQTNRRPQFGMNRSLLLLSEDSNQLKRIDVDNKFRAVIHNEDKLVSQALFMIPFSPTSSVNIEIYIKGIDIVVWELWEILIIIMLGLVVLLVVGYLIRIFVVRFKENRKLTPLLTDYPEYEEDLAEEIQRKRASSGLKAKKKEPSLLERQADQEEDQDDQPPKMGQKEDEKIGNINGSERGSVNV